MQHAARANRPPMMTGPATLRSSLELKSLRKRGNTYHSSAAAIAKKMKNTAMITKQQNPLQQGVQLQLKHPQRTLQQSWKDVGVGDRGITM